MAKNLLQDMVRVKRPGVVRVKKPTVNETEKTEIKQIKKSSGTGPRYTLWVVAVISFVFFLLALSYMFLKVTVTVNPRVQNIVLNENLSASIDATGEVLPFDLIVISGEEDKTVQATGEKDVSEKAQGIVLIYNTFSSTSQKLDIDTRLEGSNGKIYKTKKQIVVPGMKGNTPGSVEIGIYAAKAGEDYNSEPLDFKIVGFKGTVKYSKFYGRSKGEITGGYEGKAPVISDEQRLSVSNEMKNALQAKLFKKATDQIPDELVLFKDAIHFNIDNNNIDVSSVTKDSMLSIKLKGTLYGLLFNKEKLAKKIAENNSKDYDGSPLYMSNIQDLTFALSNENKVSFSELKNINFNLKGITKIVWKLDESRLVADLLGKSKKDFNQILLQYPNIDSAELVISPFWKMSFPDKKKDVKIIVNYPK